MTATVWSFEWLLSVYGFRLQLWLHYDYCDSKHCGDCNVCCGWCRCKKFSSLQPWNIYLKQNLQHFGHCNFSCEINLQLWGVVATATLQPHQVMRFVIWNCAQLVWTLMPLEYFCWATGPGFPHSTSRSNTCLYLMWMFMLVFINMFCILTWLCFLNQTCPKNCSRRCSSSFDEQKGMWFIQIFELF